MTSEGIPTANESQHLTLVVRRTIYADAERVFDAWTNPDQLRKWWGPRPVICPHVEIDLRIGGRYRIANQFPDGNVIWIEGEFELIQPPNKLVYTWRTDPSSQKSERVTVRFEPRDGATEVIIVHEGITDKAARLTHEHGWHGCLDGLGEYLKAQEAPRTRLMTRDSKSLSQI